MKYSQVYLEKDFGLMQKKEQYQIDFNLGYYLAKITD